MNQDPVHFGDECKAIFTKIREASYSNAFTGIKSLLAPGIDYPQLHKLASLLAKIPFDSLNLTPVRIAILATSTVDHLVNVLQLYLASEGFAAEFYVAPFGTLFQQALDPQSELYAFKPEVTWIFNHVRDVNFEKLNDESVQQEVAKFRSVWNAIKANSTSAIIQNNADIPWVRTFGNYDGTLASGKTRLLRHFNEKLVESLVSGVTLFDLDHVSAIFGKARWTDFRYWHHSKHAFSLDAIGEVAHQGAKIIAAIRGRAKKVMVLDLDNTLWGGVIGDDGLNGIQLGNSARGEAFVEFQEYILGLKRRGIVLAVCSKNNDEVAREVFLKHPDMRIKLDDISVFVANWQNKAGNIAEIAKILNLGLDSFVFVDDNPAERALVREMLPEVAVPELGEDPAEYIAIVERHHYFETVSFSEEDQQRADYYRDNAQRAVFENNFTNISEFLTNLQMSSQWGQVDDFHLPRFTQLINKSNQFHLTTSRYSEAVISDKLNNTQQWGCYYFKLADKFGDNGLISSIVLEQKNQDELFIDTWAMSCRVLSRTMEEFIINKVCEIAAKMGCKKVLGKYIPSSKNKLVAELYARLGFRQTIVDEGITHWEMKLVDRTESLTYVV